MVYGDYLLASILYHPQAKGILECCNGIIVAGLYRMLVKVLGVGWLEVLPDVLVGLLMLL